MASVLTKKVNLETHTQGEHHVKMKAAVGVTFYKPRSITRSQGKGVEQTDSLTEGTNPGDTFISDC